MRRLALLLGVLIVAVGTIAIWQPHLIWSLRDRLMRLAALEPGTTPRPTLAKALAAAGVMLGRPAHVRIFKESSELELWMQPLASDGSRWRHVATFPICRWSGTLGPKLREGDGQAPEGFYSVTSKALNPRSAYFLSFNLGFPNTFDRHHGRTGSFLMVHGDCVSIGCYAMTDAGISDIYAVVAAALRGGQAAVPVHVFPFRMTAANLARHAGSPWMAFWANLKDGADRFDAAGAPPEVHACGGVYGFKGMDRGCAPIQGM